MASLGVNSYQSVASKSTQNNTIIPSFLSVTEIKEKMEQFRTFKSFKSSNNLQHTPEPIHKFGNVISP